MRQAEKNITADKHLGKPLPLGTAVGHRNVLLSPAAVGQRSGSSMLHTVLNTHLTTPMSWSNSLFLVPLYIYSHVNSIPATICFQRC